MPRGPKKHLKRLAAPRSWMLGKLGGVFTVKPSSGPHKQGESLPISLFLRSVAAGGRPYWVMNAFWVLSDLLGDVTLLC
jgi:hypothetical protein